MIVREKTFANPKADDEKIVGIIYTLMPKFKLKAALIPNLANIIKYGMRSRLFQ